MLLNRVLGFFWSNNRTSLLAYIFSSIAVVVFFFYRNHSLEADFNALSLLSFLNLIFCVFSLLLSRNLLYKFYRNKTHYFFAQLPIPPIQMRLYEHISYFILSALPYLLILPFLLFHVYYSGLWSSSQLIGFLSFQLILWLFYANFSLFIAMLGRACWYVFWTVLISVSLYIKYHKNYEIDFLGFLDVRKVLFKTNILTFSFITKYIVAAVLFYISAFFLSFTIDKNAFGRLHAKETSLSRGIFILYIAALVSANFYYAHKLTLSKSKFIGLHLSQIKSNKSDHRKADYWSSSIQLNKRTSHRYAKKIARLNQELINFSKAYQLNLPPVHYQHSTENVALKPLHKPIDSDNDLEIKFNFDQLNNHFHDIERDLIIEYLKLLSRGWIEKEDKLIYLRGLAANWSWKHINKKLINSRIQFLSAYPDFAKQFKNNQWLALYQNSGACLFDSLAMSHIQNISSSISKEDWHNFILSGLNLDHTWVPLHFIRSSFRFNSTAENMTEELDIESFINTKKYANKKNLNRKQLDFSLETTELYPNVFQISLKTKQKEKKYNAIRFHLYQHDTPGQKVDFQSLTNKSFIKNSRNTKHISKLLMLKKDRFSTTFSWYPKQLDCRVYAPWKHIKL